MDNVYQEQYDQLPDELKRYIDSAQLDEHIASVLKDHPLEQAQKDAFGLEVMFVLLQMASIDEFTVNIRHNMEVSAQRADDISKMTKKIIFFPVRRFLLEHAEVSDDSEHIPTDGIVVPKKTPAAEGMPNQTTEREGGTLTTSPHAPFAGASPDVKARITGTPPRSTAKEQVLQAPIDPDAAPPENSDDIFKKRLEQPVYAPAQKNQMSENKKQAGNAKPSIKETLAKDPYRESIN